MQKGFSSLFIILGIILAIGIAGGAYYFGKSQISKSQNTVVATQAPQPTTIPSSSPDETADWKTYTDAQLGISFRYPSNGNISRLTEGINSLYISNSPGKPPYYLFNLEIENNQQNLTARQVIENEIQALRNDKNVPGGGAPALADYRESTVKDYQNGAINGFSMRWGRDSDAVNNAIEIVSIKNNKIYKFSIHDGNGSVDEFQKKLIDQILSTFKFTN